MPESSEDAVVRLAYGAVVEAVEAVPSTEVFRVPLATWGELEEEQREGMRDLMLPVVRLVVGVARMTSLQRALNDLMSGEGG